MIVYFFNKRDMKLYFGVCVVLFLALMIMIPPSDWWFFWDYLEEYPFIVVIGQAWPIWTLGALITFFLILYREVKL